MDLSKRKTLVILVASAGLVLMAALFCYSKTKNCVFVNRNICLVGRKYQKYAWQGDLAAQAFKFKKEQKVKTPFDGTFVYTPITYVNFESKTKGATSVVVFTDIAGNKIKIYADEIDLLMGYSGNVTKVKKGDIVAKIKPVPISFLDSYNLIKVSLPRN